MIKYVQLFRWDGIMGMLQKKGRIFFLLEKKRGDASDLDSQSSGQVGEWEVDRGRDEIRLT